MKAKAALLAMLLAILACSTQPPVSRVEVTSRRRPPQYASIYLSPIEAKSAKSIMAEALKRTEIFEELK